MRLFMHEIRIRDFDLAEFVCVAWKLIEKSLSFQLVGTQIMVWYQFIFLSTHNFLSFSSFFFLFHFFEKTIKSIFKPAFGVHSTNTLIKICQSHSCIPPRLLADMNQTFCPVVFFNVLLQKVKSHSELYHLDFKVVQEKIIIQLNFNFYVLWQVIASPLKVFSGLF